jgi:hypothetical protein
MIWQSYQNEVLKKVSNYHPLSFSLFSDVEFENLLEAIRATTETKEISNLVSFYSRISAAVGSFGQLKQADYRHRDICNCRYYVISSTIRMNLTYHPKGHPAWHHPFHLLPFEWVDEMT